jgi:hypothetical protein
MFPRKDVRMAPLSTVAIITTTPMLAGDPSKYSY